MSVKGVVKFFVRLEMNIMKPTVKVTVSSSTLIYSNTNTKIQTRVSKASVYFLFERNETALFICISTISLDSIFQRFLWVFSLICLDAAKNSLGSLKTLSSFLWSLSAVERCFGVVFWNQRAELLIGILQKWIPWTSLYLSDYLMLIRECIAFTRTPINASGGTWLNSGNTSQLGAGDFVLWKLFSFN